MRILIVDDNRSSADLLARSLTRRDDTAEAVYSAGAAIERLERDPPDLVLTDMRMETPTSGLDVLRAARRLRPPVQAIVFTGFGEVETAVEAMQLGALDFLTKPVTLDQVFDRIEAARVAGGQAAETGAPPPPLTDRSPAARLLLETLGKVATVPSPVWIEGEIGSGRGHAAWMLHQAGDPSAPFTVLDPARHIDWPRRGTAVLPNVDDLPDDLQRELVRSLQRAPSTLRLVSTARPGARERVIPEGPGRTRAPDESPLRQELYFKLAVIVIPVPPLRQRRDDIVPMFEDALQRFSKRYRRPAPELSHEARERLLAHGWPGNVRELLNAAERAVVLGSPLGVEVPAASPTAPDGLPELKEGFSLMDHLERIERRILVEALRQTDGDRPTMCKLLGLERNTLRYKLTKYELL